MFLLHTSSKKIKKPLNFPKVTLVLFWSNVFKTNKKIDIFTLCPKIITKTIKICNQNQNVFLSKKDFSHTFSCFISTNFLLRHHQYCWSSNIFSKIVSKFYFTSFFIFLWENLVFYVWNHSSKNLSFLTKPSFFLRTFTSKYITVSTKNLRTWSAKNLLITRSLQSLVYISFKNLLVSFYKRNRPICSFKWQFAIVFF